MVCVCVLILFADDGAAVEDCQSERADHEDGRTHIFHRVCQVEDDHLIKAMDDVADAWWMPLDKVNPDDFGLDSVRKGVARFLETCRNKK